MLIRFNVQITRAPMLCRHAAPSSPLFRVMKDLYGKSRSTCHFRCSVLKCNLLALYPSDTDVCGILGDDFVVV